MDTTIELHIMYDDSYVEPKKKYKLLATKYNVQTQLFYVLPKTHELIFVLLQFDNNYNLLLHEVHKILINEKTNVDIMFTISYRWWIWTESLEEETTRKLVRCFFMQICK